MQMARKALAAAGLALALAAAGGVARADTCCTGFYLTGVAVGGGEFVKDIENKSSGANAAGAVNKDHTQDSGAGGGLAFGFDWRRLGAPVRTEIEYVHIIRYDYDRRPVFTNRLSTLGFENNIASTTILLNVNYDFRFISDWWRPYAGFSVGYARNRSDVFWNDFGTGRKTNETTSTDNLAWGLTAGGNFDITENWYAEAAYRFLDAGDLKVTDTTTGIKLESDTVYRHELRLGVGYRF